MFLVNIHHSISVVSDPTVPLKIPESDRIKEKRPTDISKTPYILDITKTPYILETSNWLHVLCGTSEIPVNSSEVVHKKSHTRNLSRHLGNEYKLVREMQRHIQLTLKKNSCCSPVCGSNTTRDS